MNSSPKTEGGVEGKVEGEVRDLAAPDADTPPPIPESLINALNDEQRAAVLHGRGPALILAGAGSGKTRVLTHRIAGLISVGVPAYQILALTFTNKAAKEMKARVQSLISSSPELGGADLTASQLTAAAQRVTLQTFHGFGASYLRSYAEDVGRTDQFLIYDSDDRLKLIKEMLKVQRVELDRQGLADLCAAFDRAKQLGLGAEEAYSPPLDSRPGVDVKRLGWAYDEALRLADAFDFGDLIVKPLKLLEDPTRRAQLRSRFPWLLVDEFQDTNRAQLSLLQAISPADGDLFVVGDDDQSIYAWRGAEVANILGFQAYFPSARTYKLEQNYRSKGNILRAANGVIKFNSGRLGKQLWTAQDQGAKIRLYHASSDYDEARYVAQTIKAWIDAERFRYSDIAILYRANALTFNIESALMSAEFAIPHVIVRGRNFFERGVIKDALAHLRLLINPRDLVAYQRAITSAARGVGKVSLDKIARLGAELKVHLFAAASEAINRGLVKGKARRGLLDFEQLYTAGAHLEHESLAEQAEALLRAADLYHPERLQDLIDEKRRADIENLSRLIDTIRDFEDRSDQPSWFSYLEQVSLISDTDDSKGDDDGRGAVSLMTVHASKGLEFPVVFLVGLEEELFPTAMRGTESDLEEERRLFYVAVTRAERELTLSYAQVRTWHGQRKPRMMSRFLNEVDPKLIDHVRNSPLRTWARQHDLTQKSGPVGSGWKERYGDQGARSTAKRALEQPPLALNQDVDRDQRVPKRAVSATQRVRARALSAEFNVGDQVRHKSYGVGVIKRIERRGDKRVARVEMHDKERVILLSFLEPCTDASIKGGE